jgi:hypothetical protein
VSRAWKFFQLSAAEKWFVFQALLLLPVCAVFLRLGGIRRFVPSVGEAVPTAFKPEQGIALQQAHAAAKMVALAGRCGPYRANCLKRSVVTYWLLRRRGINCILRIGVRKESNKIEAHAWIECFGQPLNEGADVHQRFSPFDRIVPQEVNWT